MKSSDIKNFIYGWLTVKKISPHTAALTMIALTLVEGCASTQLNYNALDIASTYDQIITKQVTFNLHKVLEDKDGLPAFVKVTAGSVTTQVSVTPTVTVPFTSAITKLAQTSLAPTGLTTQTSRTSMLGAYGATLAATDQFNQVYTTSPVTDSDQLRRLRSLYQYVTKQLSAEDFESTYNLIETGESKTAATNNTTTTLTVTVDGKPVTITQGSSPARIRNGDNEDIVYVRRTYLPTTDGTFRGYTWTKVTPDTTFIRQPGCILCDYGRTLTTVELAKITDKVILKSNSVRKLEKNIDLRDDWLYLPGEEVDISNAVALPSNGIDTLFIRKSVLIDGVPSSGRRYFNELALFSEDASTQGTGSPTSGGQSLGRKTAPLERISIPVGGGATLNP